MQLRVGFETFLNGRSGVELVGGTVKTHPDVSKWKAGAGRMKGEVKWRLRRKRWWAERVFLIGRPER